MAREDLVTELTGHFNISTGGTFFSFSDKVNENQPRNVSQSDLRLVK